MHTITIDTLVYINNKYIQEKFNIKNFAINMAFILNKNNKNPISKSHHLGDLIDDARTKKAKHLQLLFQNLIINKELKQQRQ